jgi:hypothetical protein
VNPVDKENMAFRVACWKGNKEIAELLMKDSRVDPAAVSNEGLRLACLGGFTELVKVLLADSRINPADSGKQTNNADLTVLENLAIHNAALGGHVEIVK